MIRGGTRPPPGSNPTRQRPKCRRDSEQFFGRESPLRSGSRSLHEISRWFCLSTSSQSVKTANASAIIGRVHGHAVGDGGADVTGPVRHCFPPMRLSSARTSLRAPAPSQTFRRVPARPTGADQRGRRANCAARCETTREYLPHGQRRGADRTRLAPPQHCHGQHKTPITPAR